MPPLDTDLYLTGMIQVRLRAYMNGLDMNSSPGLFSRDGTRKILYCRAHWAKEMRSLGASGEVKAGAASGPVPPTQAQREPLVGIPGSQW